MDTLSFILGVALVVVAAIAVVAVDAFVKVRLALLDIKNLAREIEDNRNTIYRDLTDRTNDLLRVIDSRCDKLESKLINKK
jgi:Mg2+ and Co2+ transporter CorA